jgi:CheY-like chemotaxis protein
MHGTLHANSTPGQGSVFTLTLPAGFDDDADRLEAGATLGTGDDDTGASPERHEAAVPVSGSIRVLVADDVRANRMLVQRLLERAGMTVVAVADGQEAIDAVRTADPPFAVVLMDVQMPRVDGLTATAVLRDEFPALPVLGLTAGVTAEEREALEEAGMREWLSKPLQRDELIDRVQHWAAESQPSSAPIDGV